MENKLNAKLSPSQIATQNKKLDKKIILITGANSGIGKETAISLAKIGHKVIIHGRDVEKTKQAREEIISKSGNKDVEYLCADLSLKAEIPPFVDKVKQKCDYLDVLINNAGGQFGNKREESIEGHEKTFAINTLAPFLLTHLLLPLLQKSKNARVVTVSSESYKMGGKPPLEDIELKHNYSLFKSYGLSKLYVWWIMREFVEYLKAQNITNITINTVEPGSVESGLQRESGKGILMKIITILWKPMMWSMEKAAATSIYMATSSEVEGVTGKFYGDCKEKIIKDKYISPKAQKALWDYCQKVCEGYL
ncbi:ketoreductase [Helicobacter sp. 16-1353]|uniref:SDR family NAD(P)-dependent oxidoreductase n=1 Tax=Helicobacter sp. 16-1353 TaxID=2004996 RepID=UPI000DCDF40F|nr:SDR family NAD(P)-dependent oxidoreductase [Helicobacter sp. 16-1353]RAX55312.1 ketoreductase [Helicobacter sp. 16-1353]